MNQKPVKIMASDPGRKPHESGQFRPRFMWPLIYLEACKNKTKEPDVETPRGLNDK